MGSGAQIEWSSVNQIRSSEAGSSWLHPDPWHMPCAYWFWHGIPSDDEIVTQVRQMYDAGLRSFQIQSRLRLPLADYLTPPYLAAYRRAVDEAAARGMVVGIYDDYNWQSGHAAGRAVAGHDHLRERHMFWASLTVDGSGSAVEVTVDGITSSTEALGPAGMAWHFEGGLPSWADWQVKRALVVDRGQVVDVTSHARVARDGDGGCSVSIAVPENVSGDLTVFVSARCASSRLINFMDRTAVVRFIEAGYDPIAEAVGHHIGSTVQYLFFDQPHPNFYSWAQHHGQLGNSMPYSDAFFQNLEQRYGDDLGRVLLTVLEGSSAEDRAVRSRFYEGYSNWALETFLGTVREWTSARGLLLSGHEVLPHVGGWRLDGAFRTWDLRVNFGLDFFATDAYRDLTASDAQDSTAQLSAKMADSAARSHGRRGTMVEQYYGAGRAGTGFYTGHWGLTLSELRAQGIRHHLLGMRQLIEHGFYQTDGDDDDVSMFANPRFDFPPGMNFEPWFEDFHAEFALETARLSQFLDDTTLTREIAVLYPLRTIWADTQNSPHAAEFGAWCERLSAESYGYDVIDEADLVSATVADGALQLGERAFRALVLPHVTTLLHKGTVERLAALAEAGVTVIATGDTPHVYQEGDQSAARDWAALGRHQHVHHGPGVAALSDLADVVGPPGREDVEVMVQGARPWLVHGLGRAGADRLVAFNDDSDVATLSIAVPDGKHPVRWHAQDGRLEELASEDGRVHVRLEPMQLLLLEIGRVVPEGADAELPEPVWSSAAEPLREGWSLEFRPVGDQALIVRDTVDVDTGLESQGFAEVAGTGTYRRVLTVASPETLRIELPAVVGSAELAVNGVVVGRCGWGPYRFVVPADRIMAGDNVLEVSIVGTAANRYYAGTGLRAEPEEAGLLAAPLVRRA